ncbi:HAMP domain-containing histidine kinase [Salinimonas iocasae]|uniref:HAMP domain-containing histidine kinase n=2 Tax=Salinimonas iocasae TaxID=2572577 RepID=A0A5B7YGA4_9ALTE|nr:HAMP domain-containing histidine kinase [Salinimonas iocasae]
MRQQKYNDAVMHDFEAAPPQKIEFSSVLAAAVHDMKNSLCLLIQSIEQLSDSIDAANIAASKHVADVHYEASRLNTSLVQILSLYRAQLETLPITIDEHFVADVLEDVLNTVKLSVNQRNFSVTIDCDPDLAWYMDGELIYLLVNDAVINALRYGNNAIHVSAKVADNKLFVKVEDDGQGYPDTMLAQSNKALSSAAVSQGRTGLGLYFARLIANAHNRHGQRGEITLQNGGKFGGSVFMVKIP